MSEENQVVELIWRGPLAIPKLEETSQAYRDIHESHVYFYIRKYPERTLAYVGRADNLIWRVQQHFCGFLGLLYAHRDDAGEWTYNSGIEDRSRAFDRIDDFIQPAIEETKRLKFFFARCEPYRLKAVESALINQVKDRAESEKKPKRNLICENDRREYHGWYEPPLTIRSSHDPKSPEASGFLELMFGEDPIVWGGNSE